MAYAVVQHQKGILGFQVPGAITLAGGAPGAGNMLFMSLHCNVLTASIFVNSPSWTDLVDAQVGLSTYGMGIGRYAQSGDGATLPAVWTAGATYWAYEIWEISGVSGDFGTDIQAIDALGLAGNQTTIAAGTLATTTANTLALVSAGQYDGTANPTLPSPWTTDDAGNNGANYGSIVGGHQAVSGSGTNVDATVTYNANAGPCSIVMAIIGPGTPPPADAHMSEAVRLTVGAGAPSARMSAAVRLTVGDSSLVAHVSQAVRLTVAEGIPCVTYFCQCWRITRRDGVVLCFTSLDENFAWGTEIYRTCNSLSASASQSQTALGGVGSIEADGIISDDGISADELYGGMYDDAFIEVWEVAYQGTQSPKRIAAGWTGNLSQGEQGFKMEVIGAGARLAQQPICKNFTPGCRWIYGSKECGKDIEALKATGTILNARNRSIFLADVLTMPSQEVQWTDGKVRWTSGRNAGYITEVQRANFGTGGVEVVLWILPPFVPEFGDTFDILPGCDHIKTSGCALNDNIINFGGFSVIPGDDSISQTPNASV